MGVGKRIKEILERKNMTVASLSESTGIPSTTLYSMIKRDKDDEKFDTLMKIGKAINVSLAELVGEGNMVHYVDDVNKDLGVLDWSDELEKELSKLNSDGKKKAIELIELLTKIPEYLKQDVNESEKNG